MHAIPRKAVFSETPQQGQTIKLWRVKQGKWRYRPRSRADALETAKKLMHGSNEPVILQPVWLVRKPRNQNT